MTTTQNKGSYDDGGQTNQAFEMEPNNRIKGEMTKDNLDHPPLRIFHTNGNIEKLNAKNIQQSPQQNEDFTCGIGFIHPEWIQRFATKKCFLVVFSLLGVVQGMSWSYFTATITTLEKRFKISSQTAGIVMTGNEISQIVFSLFLGYYGGKGHRPRWIAVGVLFSALSCFVLASPQLFYGSGEDALSLTEEYASLYDPKSFLSKPIPMTSFTTKYNATDALTSSKKSKVTLCSRSDSKVPLSSCDSLDNQIFPLMIVFLSQFVAGIGVLLYFTLGGPYLDDNTKRKNLPMVFGVTMSLRLVGPTIGYLIASGALKLYINPLLTPIIRTDDPRWLGAWWLGWVIFGFALGILSFFISLFPRELPENNGKPKKQMENSSESLSKLSDIPKAVTVLLKNKVNLFNTLAGLFYLFSAIGYWTYMPKYLETIFMQTASNASVISGLVGIFCQSAGMLMSGYLISKFQPSARKLAAWNIIIAFLYVIFQIGFTQLGCNVGKLSFGQKTEQGTWNLTSSCNADCGCKVSKILPVCHQEENTVYYSACHAGCSSFVDEKIISNCTCLPTPETTVTLGNCSEGCLAIFIIFLGVNAVIKLIDATGRTGNLLISYRCVPLKDRSLSIGLSILLLSLFAMLPSPIIFGAIIDSVCLVWGGESHCGKKGNCMLYDGERLRYLFNLTAAGFTFIGGLFDCLVLYYVKDLELYKEVDEGTDADLEEKQEKGKMVLSEENNYL